MRLWSIHPSYLDTKGLLALWRESLLAKKVLKGQTKGYTKHPQLERFKQSDDPLNLINHYLNFIWQEANIRGYNFDQSKIENFIPTKKLPVTRGQIIYELDHLTHKLKIRSPHFIRVLPHPNKAQTHPIFYVVEGDIEAWEKLSF
ncbi:pyrimidine dimer DNA glycosylase/endonuclease V [Patescibacteria group bacterium]|nr:pyrimidine dimer DNA glycosylase/endonuclease V [Patescibacteria group bacterium]